MHTALPARHEKTDTVIVADAATDKQAGGSSASGYRQDQPYTQHRTMVPITETLKAGVAYQNTDLVQLVYESMAREA